MAAQRRPVRVPKLGRHASGQARAVFNGRSIYFGRFGEPATEQAYRRYCAEWLASGRSQPPQDDGDLRAARPAGEPAVAALSVAELALRYQKHAEQLFTDRRGVAQNLGRIDRALRYLVQSYGLTAAANFTPKRLRLVRDDMIRAGLSRSRISPT